MSSGEHKYNNASSIVVYTEDFNYALNLIYVLVDLTLSNFYEVIAS